MLDELGNISDTFALFAEVSIALVGFAGVATAFGGSDRAYRPAESARLLGLFEQAGPVFVACVLLHALALTGMEARINFSIVSAGMALLMSRFALHTIPRIYRLAADSESATSPITAHLTVAMFFSCIGLYVVNLFLGGEAWPLAVCFTVHLATAVWLFTRLLTLRA